MHFLGVSPPSEFLFILELYKNYMKKHLESMKDEFLRLRIDKEEKRRLELLSKVTRRQKSDLVRESLYELYKNKYPECLLN